MFLDFHCTHRTSVCQEQKFSFFGFLRKKRTEKLGHKPFGSLWYFGMILIGYLFKIFTCCGGA